MFFGDNESKNKGVLQKGLEDLISQTKKNDSTLLYEFYLSVTLINSDKFVDYFYQTILKRKMTLRRTKERYYRN